MTGEDRVAWGPCLRKENALSPKHMREKEGGDCRGGSGGIDNLSGARPFDPKKSSSRTREKRPDKEGATQSIFLSRKTEELAVEESQRKNEKRRNE